VPALNTLVRPARVVVALALLTAACSPDAVRSPTAPAAARFDVIPIGVGAGGPGAPTRLDFATYDGSREVVHPDVVRAPESLGGGLLGVVTPYPNSQSKYENPSVFGSADGASWSPPTGVANPLASTTRGYLSDPDILYDPAHQELRMFFREVVMSGKHHLGDNVYYMTSADGVQWSAKTLATVEKDRYVVSPSIALDTAGAWRMWTVDAGRDGCDSRETRLMLRRSSDGRQWTANAPVRFNQPGYLPWHVDVEWVPSLQQYWALVAAYPKGSHCTSTSLFLATSPDGETWTTFRAPVLARGAVPQFATNVYRSSLLYEADGTVTLWMSGARTLVAGTKKKPETLQWSAAVARTTATTLLARVNGPAPAAANRSGPAPVIAVGNDVP
jgi:hypothetical protein